MAYQQYLEYLQRKYKLKDTSEESLTDGIAEKLGVFYSLEEGKTGNFIRYDHHKDMTNPKGYDIVNVMFPDSHQVGPDDFEDMTIEVAIPKDIDKKKLTEWAKMLNDNYNTNHTYLAYALGNYTGCSVTSFTTSIDEYKPEEVAKTMKFYQKYRPDSTDYPNSMALSSLSEDMGIVFCRYDADDAKKNPKGFLKENLSKSLVKPCGYTITHSLLTRKLNYGDERRTQYTPVEIAVPKDIPKGDLKEYLRVMKAEGVSKPYGFAEGLSRYVRGNDECHEDYAVPKSKQRRKVPEITYKESQALYDEKGIYTI